MAHSRKSEALFNEARITEDALRAALGRLSGRLSGRRDATDELIGLATGPLGQTVLATTAARALRSYPLATVLVGAGLAWLTFGSRHEDSLTDRVQDTIDDWQDRADAARDAARDRLTALYDDMSDRGTDAAAFAREKATVTADLAADLASAFAHGLSDLGSDAAERIIAARERAYSAFASGAESGAEALGDAYDALTDSDDDRNFLRRHPVASAAVAVALGAALATALQANRRDGESLADTTEHLLAKARKTFDTERTAAGRAIGEAASALRARGTEAALAMVSDLTSILENARNKGRDTLDSVEDAAEDAEASVRKTTRRAAGKVSDKVGVATKRISAEARNRRRATQKLADKLTRSRAS